MLKSLTQAIILLFLFPLFVFASEPVDTLQFGHIRNGMSDAEVEKRLGPPGKILEEPKTLVPVVINGRREYREKRRYVWIYPGSSQIMTSYIYFEDGRVTDKAKRP